MSDVFDPDQPTDPALGPDPEPDDELDDESDWDVEAEPVGLAPSPLAVSIDVVAAQWRKVRDGIDARVQKRAELNDEIKELREQDELLERAHRALLRKPKAVADEPEADPDPDDGDDITNAVGDWPTAT